MKLAKYSTKFSKKQIILLSIPVFFSNLAIPLVGIVDTGLMGNLGETKYLAATSIATSVMTMVIWSFGFLRMGTVGIVSQAYGRGDYREIVRTVLRNFVIAMAIALAIIILKPLINISIQHFFNTSAETQNLINTYLNVRVLPKEFKLFAKSKIEKFIDRQKFNTQWIQHPMGQKRWQGLIDYMCAEDWSEKLPQTKDYLRVLDKNRGTDFTKTFPELGEAL